MKAIVLTASTACLALMLVLPAGAQVGSHEEDFSTTYFRDAVHTSADWNTGTEILGLWPLGLEEADTDATPGSAAGVALSGNYAFVADATGGFHSIDITTPGALAHADSITFVSPVHGVAVAGNYAYLAVSGAAELVAVDIANPEDVGPAYSGDQAGNGWGVGVAGNHAYVAAGSGGLAVYDITDPMLPERVGQGAALGEARAVVVAGDYAYVADFQYCLVSYDISDPTSVGAGSPSDVLATGRGVAVDGDYAYVADEAGYLRIFDISDPESPTEAGSIATPGAATGVAVEGDYVYVADASVGVAVIDITDPGTLRFVGSFTPGTTGEWIALAGEHAYLAAGAQGLVAIDIADPVVPPVQIAETFVDGAPARLTLSGDYLYVADGEGGELDIIDVTHPRDPEVLDPVNTPGMPQDVEVWGDYLYVADGSPSLTVLSIEDPSKPGLGGNVAVGDREECTNVLAIGDTLYITIAKSSYFNGVQIIDVSDPVHPAIVKGCYLNDLGNSSYGLSVIDTIAYVADNRAGLQVVNLNTCARTTYDTPGEAYDVAIVGQYAYVADGESGIQVVDVTAPPDTLALVGEFDTPGFARDIQIVDTLAFVADDSGGLLVLSIADPTEPDSLGLYPTIGPAYSVFLVDTLAYVACNAEGLRILNVSDPTNPVSLSLYDVASWSPWGNVYMDVAVEGDYAYVSDMQEGLRVIDVSDPAAPDSSWMCMLPGTGNAVAVTGGYAYVADGLFGLQVVDVGNHRNPNLVHAFETLGVSRGVAVDGDYAFTTDTGPAWSPQGIISSDITDPERPTLGGWSQKEGNYFSGWGGDLVIDGDYAFCATPWTNAGAGVVDISDPTDMVIVSRFEYSFGSVAVEVDGNRAYVASNWYGLEVVDIEDPTAPVHLGGTDGGATRPMALELKGDHAFVASNENGFLPVDISNPASPLLLEGSEPFNAQGLAVAGDYAYVSDYDSGLRVFSVFSREARPDSNAAQSVDLVVTDEPIARASLDATYTDSIRWELNVVPSEEAWSEIHPGGPGLVFGTPDTLLRWRAHLYPVEAGLTPSCDTLSIEWWYECPLITSVLDIPEDQGGWTRISFTRSGYDFEDDSSPTDEYCVWRRVDNPALKGRVRDGVLGRPEGKHTREREAAVEVPELGPTHSVATIDGRIFALATQDNPHGFPRDTAWEYVTDVAAMQQEAYMVAVPTYEDGALGDVNIFLEFENESNYIEPPAFGTVTATIYLENFPPGEGMRAVDLMLNQTFGGFRVSATNLLDLEIGDPETGWSLASNTCVMPDENGRVAVAVLEYLYNGSLPGALEIGPNPVYGQSVWDCDMVQQDWCVRLDPSGHGGVWSAPPPGDCAPAVDTPWVVYRVSAHRADPTEWYVSPPDSGYSIDDLAPAPPGGLKIPAQLTLSWDPNGEIDLDHYTIYAVDDEEALDEAEAVATTEETECPLSDETVGRYVFVTASDLSGNESAPSELLWNTGTSIPESHFLAQNVPNPFNPVTTIRFGLPERAEARIEIYDVAGRVVRVLAEGTLPAGEHEVVWDGRDGHGHAVSSGVYFYRMEAGEYRAERKMLLLK